MEFVALGKSDVIGASCLFLKINNTGVVLDAGADPDEEGEDSLPRFDMIRRKAGWYADHVLITHAHHDHLGALPVLLREFPHAVVHMTPATRALADLLLPASARLQRKKLREGSSSHDPLFSEEELEMHRYLYLEHDLETPFLVKGLKETESIEATFFDAGHVLGSAGVLLEFTEEGTSRRVFYTSDTNLRPQSIIPGGAYPSGPIDVMILESTLAADPDAELTTRKKETERFGRSIQEVLDRGGTVLIPSFALGRAQEVLNLLDSFKKSGLIDPDIPIYTAGSMRAVADLYDKTRLLTPRLDPEFQVFGVPQKRLPRSDKATREALRKPSIHVVGSGMMFERTISNRLAQQLIEDKKNAIFLVGYAKEGSPADRLLLAAELGNGAEVVLDPLRGPQPAKCQVDRFRFSGHSHRRDLLQLVEKLKPKKILLVHGEDTARTWMADNISYFYPDIEIILPQTTEPLEVF